jgi:hypothetical protein
MNAKPLSADSGVGCRRWGVFCAIFISIAITSAAKAASTNLGGTGCIPASVGDWNKFTFAVDGFQATANNVEIVCPIWKTTSGPGVTTGDNITSVSVTINNHSHSPGIQCQVTVYNSQIPSSGTNYVTKAGPTTSATGATTISFTSGITSVVGWWGTNTWDYAQLECILQNGESLTDYTVNENGTDNHNYIYPFEALCWPDTSTGTNTHITYYSSLANGTTGALGMGEAPGSETDPLFFECYIPGATMQFSLGPTINTSTGWVWSYDESGPWGITHKEAGSGQSSEWPSLNFPGSVTDVSSGLKSNPLCTGNGCFLDTSTEGFIYFQQTDTDGDMAFLTARVTGD